MNITTYSVEEIAGVLIAEARAIRDYQQDPDIRKAQSKVVERLLNHFKIPGDRILAEYRHQSSEGRYLAR